MKLTAMEHYLTKTTSAQNVADRLDEIIFDIIYIYGQASEPLTNSCFADMMYELKDIRNIFAQTAKENDES